MTERRSSRLTLGAVLLAGAGLVPFGRAYLAAREAERRPYPVGHATLVAPEVVREKGGFLISRNLTLEQILARRRYLQPDEAQRKLGCASAPGISTRGEEPILLLAETAWGRLAEVPGKGITVLSPAESAELSAPGKCAPAEARPVAQPPKARAPE